MMAVDISAFETLVPCRFVAFTFPNPKRPRSSNLRVAVLDSPILQDGRQPQVAAMLVPENREDDWIFCTESGQLQLLFSHSPDLLSRLILVGNEPSSAGNGGSISTLKVYPRIEVLDRFGLGETLDALLIGLTPKSWCDGSSVPISVYEDELVSSVIREKCIGSVVGEMLIEDVEVETEEERGSREFRRRLRFKRMPNLIQTQVRILPVDFDTNYCCLEDISSVRFMVDSTVLVHPYLAPMVAALSLLMIDNDDHRKKRPKVLCLGVGGGALISFLREQLDFEVVGVEADGEVLRVAKEYFHLQVTDENILVGDAMQVIEKLAAGENIKFDVVMVDLDSGDVGTGLIAPPWEFVNDKSVVVGMRSILSDWGILVVNVVPPNRAFYDRFVSEFRKSFVELYEIDIGNGENFVVIATVGATPTDSSASSSSSQMKQLLKSVVSEAWIKSIKKI